MSQEDFAHELRTPLTAIRGAIDLLALRQSVQDDAGAEVLLELAQRNVDRLMKAIEECVEDHGREVRRQQQQAVKASASVAA
jgi:signal transduction histidine kinase